jgi:hypothetical protein
VPDASTGDLVLTAAIGGLGAFLEAGIGQVVQLYRDRQQYRREDTRHEHERQLALEDTRTARREERYVAVLTAVEALRRRANECTDVVRMWNELRQLVEDPQTRDREELRPFLSQLLGWRQDLARDLTEAREQANAAYSVASGTVRDACRALSSWPLMFRPDALTETGAVTLNAEVKPEVLTPNQYATRTVQELGTVERLCDDLERLIRAELALD